jgi:ubiquinone/menaquinone biosynthesis C-methylase UbiE
MAKGHLGVTEPVIAEWDFDVDSVVLDVGCGNGWAVRRLVELGAATGIGVDISPKMVSRARALTAEDSRFRFEVASAQRLPLADASVSHLLNVESLYYYPDPAAAIVEWARVTRPGGTLAIVVDLYAESPATHSWIDSLAVDVHLLSAPQIVQMVTEAGWKNPRHTQVIDPRPVKTEAEFEPSKYWPSYAMYRSYRETGALVVAADR